MYVVSCIGYLWRDTTESKYPDARIHVPLDLTVITMSFIVYFRSLGRLYETETKFTSDFK
jgi:hypothetical protein